MTLCCVAIPPEIKNGPTLCPCRLHPSCCSHTVTQVRASVPPSWGVEVDNHGSVTLGCEVLSWGGHCQLQGWDNVYCMSGNGLCSRLASYTGPTRRWWGLGMRLTPDCSTTTGSHKSHGHRRFNCTVTCTITGSLWMVTELEFARIELQHLLE